MKAAFSFDRFIRAMSLFVQVFGRRDYGLTTDCGGRSSGKTGTNCEAAGAQCTKAKKWIGTTLDGKKWSCTF